MQQHNVHLYKLGQIRLIKTVKTAVSSDTFNCYDIGRMKDISTTY